MDLTKREMQTLLASISDNLQEHLNTIVTQHPQNEEGFPVIADPDLAQAVKVIEETISQLSRICFHLGIGDNGRS